MKKFHIPSAMALAAVVTLGLAPAASATSASETTIAGGPELRWVSSISGALTGFESRNWTVKGGSSTVNLSGCSSVGTGPDQNTTHVSQWKHKALLPDDKSGDSAKLSACFGGPTSTFTRSIETGASAYFKIDRINGEVSGSGLDVETVNVSE